ncbi:MAG: GspH/FimT family protein [Pseudomonadota bacterium]
MKSATQRFVYLSLAAGTHQTARPRLRLRLRRSRGYSLLELLIASAIVAILLQASAGGGLQEMVLRNERQVAAQELMRLIQFSRSEAINRGDWITLCAIDSSGQCRADWTDREVVVFQDLDANRRLNAERGEIALQRMRWPEDRGALQWRAALRYPAVTYSPIGSALQNGSFTLCQHGAGKQANWVLSINRGGRPYMNTRARRQC